MTPEEERMMMALMKGMKNPYTSPQVTMESQVADQLRNIDPNNIPGYPQTPGMPELPPSGDAVRSTKGARQKLNAQQAYADNLRGTPMPKGQSVGPSGIYVNNPWDAAEAGFNRAYGGYLSGQLKGEYDALDERDTNIVRAQQGREEAIRQEGQQFVAEQAGLKRAVDQTIASERNATTARGQSMQQETAQLGREAQVAAAATATANRRGESMEGGNYVIDGKLTHVVKDSTGNYRRGTIDGAAIPADVMERAVEYRPGTDKGTYGDEGAFPIAPEDAGEAPPRFMGNLLTSDYFDKSTGIVNPERWAGSVGLGPDGGMVKATQSQMATATLGQMAGRMEVINLRPWTEKEIETITADFPGPNSKYADWANFSHNLLRPKLTLRFDEAIDAGRSTPEMRDQVMQQLDHDIIEGARKNGVSMADLEQLGIPRESIVAYLKSL